MKKYNLYDLFVIKKNIEDREIYLICKKSEFGIYYKEIFTNKKFKVDKSTKIEPLYNYLSFSFISKFNINSKISKEEIFENFILTNDNNEGKKDSIIVEKNESKIEESKEVSSDVYSILDTAVKSFFPKRGHWYAPCFNRYDDLDTMYFPCHLNNDEWLAKMLKLKVKTVSESDILTYVKTSTLFNTLKHEYGLKVVKWQIDWMINGGDNWIIDNNLGGDYSLISPVCDIAFRKGVVDTLTRIGMDKELIEEGLEKYSSVWRDKYMNLAFEYEYNPVFPSFELLYEDNNKVNLYKKLEPADELFKANWLKVRKYDYYQKHKESVDKYGVVESDMLISENDANSIKEYLYVNGNKRKEYINKVKTLKK